MGQGRKQRRTYYFSVEGDTEKWYLDWLQEAINTNEQTQYVVKLDSKVEKDPLARVKRLAILSKTEITHVFDRESEEAEHQKQFQATLDLMKKAQGTGKQIKYVLGYSNFTFDLWMILHKMDCYASFVHRDHYLNSLNKAYEEHFATMKEYKREENFKRVLSKLSLEDVRKAIGRAKKIKKQCQDAGYTLCEYKGYRYYRENPSLSIWECIEKILRECGVL